jgi:hypothetical protein
LTLPDSKKKIVREIQTLLPVSMNQDAQPPVQATPAPGVNDEYTKGFNAGKTSSDTAWSGIVQQLRMDFFPRGLWYCIPVGCSVLLVMLACLLALAPGV